MAPIRVGVDFGQSHIRVGALVLSKYIVVGGTKDIKVNGPEAPDRHQVVEIFHDVNDVVKSYFGAPNFQAAVVVVPNSTSDDNKVAIAGAGARYNIMEVITENTAVAAAYAYKVKPTQSKRLAIVSVTAGILDVSIYSINSDTVFFLETNETHPEPIEFEEHHEQESSHSRPGGLIGLVGGVVGGAVKTLVLDPLDKAFDIVKNLLSSPKLTEWPVDEVVFVGKAYKSEKLKQAVKERFPNARVWSPEDIKPEELAAYGAAVIAFKQLTPEKREPSSIRWRSDGGPPDLPGNIEDAIKAAEENLRDEKPGEEYGEDDESNESSKKSIGDVHFFP